MHASYHFTLKGYMPLLMHADDVQASDTLSLWRKAPENKNVSQAGDDRSPPWTWQTYLYSDGEHIAMPFENIMVAIRQAGTQIILKKQKTFKEITQSGLLIRDEFCRFTVGGKQIAMREVDKLKDRPFTEHLAAAQKLGFKLFVKRARVGQAKHVRVRARFDKWEVSGIIDVLVPEISHETLAKLFELAGKVGLCDWRPGCKTPGPYGMFTSELKVA